MQVKIYIINVRCYYWVQINVGYQLVSYFLYSCCSLPLFYYYFIFFLRRFAFHCIALALLLLASGYFFYFLYILYSVNLAPIQCFFCFYFMFLINQWKKGKRFFVLYFLISFILRLFLLLDLAAIPSSYSGIYIYIFAFLLAHIYIFFFCSSVSNLG